MGIKMSNAESGKESHVDVLIIGAGPAGLMACNALARNGINVRIVDIRPSKVTEGHADGLQPRTLEVLKSYGLADKVFKDGAHMHMAAFYNPSPNGGIELTDRVPDVTAPSARFPFEITLNQGEIETIFIESMQRFGVEVDRPTAPLSMEISDADTSEYPIKTVLQHHDESQETETVYSKYVVGADGAHSWVRKAFGIPMVGEQMNYIWGVVDFIPDTDFPDIRNRTAIHSNNGSCMVIPREGDKVRLYVQLDEQSGLVNEAGRIDKSKVTPEHLLEIARKSMHPYKIATPDSFEWWTLYNIGQRVASSFSVDDRVFIVGDACHTHSPKAGQGMNASMGDSHNLAWKISQVVKGWSTRQLLDTYALERKKYAEDLLDFDKKFASLFSGKPRTEEHQDGVSHAEFLRIFQTFGGFSSGIGTHYEDSVITRSTFQRSAQNLIVGQRLLPQMFLRAADFRPVEIQDLLPSDGRFKILVFTGDSSVPSQLQKINVTTSALKNALGVVARECGCGEEQIHDLFEILGISSAGRLVVRYNDLPALLRPHWSRALIDGVDVSGKIGGDGYKNYGIGPEGAMVVVRPDGYVGLVAPFEVTGVSELLNYFEGFTKA